MNDIAKYRIILSGGGTGGHIFPAVAVAEALVRKLGDRADILFVGAEGKMEMELVPGLGYRIEGLPVAGLQRKLSVGNLALPYKVARSLRAARGIIKRHGADVVAGFGGYASAPVLWSAQGAGIPTVIQEQNSYAGLTNKILGRRAGTICVAYDKMERFFAPDKIVPTGNPLRSAFTAASGEEHARSHFGLANGIPVVLVLGGSLGTRTLNNAMQEWLSGDNRKGEIQFIWQHGRHYQSHVQDFMKGRDAQGVWYGAFIDRMDLAYAAADVIISRSGAITVSELCLAAKPVVFVPSPNVAEDHQTKNAMAIAEQGAALMVRDSEAVDRAIPTALELLGDRERAATMAANIGKLGRPRAADRIADIIIEAADSSRSGATERRSK